MTRVDPGRVESHLRRLDAAACRALVADLWSARGFETTREGDVVVADRNGESQVVYVATARASGPERRVDVVVAIGGNRPDVSDDVRVLDATDLCEMLLYAVDRPVAVDLCTRHLGAPPDELAPPLSTRLRNRGAAVASTARSTPFALVLVACFVVVAGAAYAPPSADADDADQQSAGAPTATATPDDGSSSPSRADADSPPGVGTSGVTNLSALASAHSRVLDGRAYTLWLDYSRPRGWEPNGTRVQRDTDVAVDGDRFFGETTLEGPESRTPVQAVYYDGSDWYIADASDDGTRYRRIQSSGGAPALYADPSTVRYTLVTEYLSTPETTVTERRSRGDDVLYRLVGRGRPTGLGAARAENYTVVAYVDSRGLVRDLTARYRRETDDGPIRVVVEVTYGRFGSTSVTPPPWYEREFGNETRGDEPGAGAD
ncbi:MAG: hypothetical protein ABEJ78_08130 [Haloferacaceae archaeon]